MNIARAERMQRAHITLPRRLAMSRRAQVHTSLLSVIAVVLVSVPFIWPRYWWKPVAAQAPAIPTDFRTTLIRAGLDFTALAAAGVSTNSVSSVLQAVAASINNDPSRLSNADSAYATARRDVDRLKALIESGKASQEDTSSYQSASTSLATASAARQAALDAYFAAGAGVVTEGQRATLTSIRTNRGYEMPIEFLVVNRSQQEWVDLRDALANERIEPEVGEEPDSGDQAALASWRAVNAVASAKSSTDANLASVTTSWNSASVQ
jgi:hypothetical protein